jgi:Na+/H+ antiporter NhaD/arsenite permease-like protein
VALFIATYVGITARRVRLLPVGRPAMALVGAVALTTAGQLAGAQGLTVDEALRAVEPNTIALLLGMMLLAASLGDSGFFAAAAAVLVERAAHARARGPLLLWLVTVGCGLLSAVLVNDAVCLLATPLVVIVVRAARLPLPPFVFAVAMGSNAGSALTLSGNPQNMLVAQLSGLSYRGYLSDAALPTLGALVVTAALLHAMFRRALTTDAPVEPAPPAALRRGLLWVTVAALVGVVVANLCGASLALSALAGATVALIASRLRAEVLLSQVDWSVLLFFGALFVVVAALNKTGLPAEWLAEVGAPPPGGRGLLTLSLVVAIGSQIVSNVPLIMLLEPWIRAMPDPALAWTLTALVSTLAGNLTLLGSVAIVIVIERAQAPIGFFAYLRVGVPVTLCSTAVALALLWAAS